MPARREGASAGAVVGRRGRAGSSQGVAGRQAVGRRRARHVLATPGVARTEERSSSSSSSSSRRRGGAPPRLLPPPPPVRRTGVVVGARLRRVPPPVVAHKVEVQVVGADLRGSPNCKATCKRNRTAVGGARRMRGPAPPLEPHRVTASRAPAGSRLVPTPPAHPASSAHLGLAGLELGLRALAKHEGRRAGRRRQALLGARIDGVDLGGVAAGAVGRGGEQGW